MSVMEGIGSHVDPSLIVAGFIAGRSAKAPMGTPQLAVPLGPRHARSNGRRQARGATSWWIDFGPQEPGS